LARGVFASEKLLLLLIMLDNHCYSILDFNASQSHLKAIPVLRFQPYFQTTKQMLFNPKLFQPLPNFLRIESLTMLEKVETQFSRLASFG
jgi:hypothetical protein